MWCWSECTTPRHPHLLRPDRGSMDPLWEPTQEQIQRAQLTRFMSVVSAPDYPSLYRWSVDEPEAFWSATWRFCGIIADGHQGAEPWDQVLLGRDRVAPPAAKVGPRWFLG